MKPLMIGFPSGKKLAKNISCFVRPVVRYIRRFCESSSIHGLKYVMKQDLTISQRLYFVFMIICCAFVFVYFVLDFLLKLRDSPIYIDTDPKPHDITTLPFPAVTICNLNKLNGAKMQNMSIFSHEYAYAQLICGRPISEHDLQDPPGDQILEFLKEFAIPCHELLLECKFGGVKLNCSTIFTDLTLPDGICCTFNMVHAKYFFKIPPAFINLNEENGYPVPWSLIEGYPNPLPKNFYPRTVPGTGLSTGLILTLNISKNNYYCSNVVGAGVKVMLHSPVEFPNVDTQNLLPPGNQILMPMKTSVERTAQAVTALKPAERKCFLRDEKPLINLRYYTKMNCRMSCLAQMLMDHCKCVTYYLTKLTGNYTYCTTKQNTCAQNIQIMFRRTFDQKENCFINCISPCNELLYEANVQITPLLPNSNSFKGTRLENVSAAHIKENIIFVYLYFPDSTFRTNRLQPLYGTADFLSNIGGLLSTCFGFSFMSLAEIVFFFILLPLRLFYQDIKIVIAAYMYPPTSTVILPSKFAKKRKFSKNKHSFYYN